MAVNGVLFLLITRNGVLYMPISRYGVKRKQKKKRVFLRRFKKKLVGDHRERDKRERQTSFGIADAQSVKTTHLAERRGFDAGKKINGIKRHIVVDTNGLPHALAVTTADVTDRNGAILALSQAKDVLTRIKKLLVDGGYTGRNFARAVKRITKAIVEVVKRNELHSFAVLPKRWVVERTFAWLEKYRRLWKNCERKLSTSLQVMVFAFIAILLKRL